MQKLHDREHLARYSKGLIGLSACLGGEVAKALEVDDLELARNVAGEYRDIFGPDKFFLELQDHGLPEQTQAERAAAAARSRRSACRSSSPTTCITFTRTNPTLTTCCCASARATIDTPGRLKFETHEFYLKSAAQMAALSRTGTTRS